MQEKREILRVRVDGYTRVCLAVIAVLLTVLIVGLWAERTPGPAQARAGELFLDSAGQRDQMIKAQQDTNQKLDELIRLLESGRVKVQTVQEEGQGAGGKDAAPPKKK